MNVALFQAINQWAGANPFIDDVMVFISQYALFLYAGLFLLLWIKGNDKMKRSVLYAGCAGILALLLNGVIATFYFEPRPFVDHAVHLLITHAKDASFPSDHTSGAFALAIAMFVRHRNWGYPMLVLAILTGFSRIFIGFHYPLDIVGSIVVALLATFIVFRTKRKLRPVLNWVIHVYKKLVHLGHKNEQAS